MLPGQIFQVPAAADPKTLISLLAPEQERSSFDHGGIGTTLEAGELAEAGRANFSDPRWLELVEDAAQRNGGYGSPEEGYLAWGKNGFFRFRNDTIPPELSAEFARISLTTGLRIERLKITSEYDADDVKSKVEFVTEFNSSLQAFMADPSKGFKVEAGSAVFAATANSAGGIQFIRYKKPNWFQKTIGKVAKWLSPVLNVAGWIVPVLKPFTTAISLGINAVNKFVAKDYADGVKKQIK